MQKKKIPTFKTEKDEREFWAREDSAEYIDWSKAKRAVFPHLKPSLKTISLRLPASMIEELKILANKKDVPPTLDETFPLGTHHPGTFNGLFPFLQALNESREEDELLFFHPAPLQGPNLTMR
jgi:hypothetical protein